MRMKQMTRKHPATQHQLDLELANAMMRALSNPQPAGRDRVMNEPATAKITSATESQRFTVDLLDGWCKA